METASRSPLRAILWGLAALLCLAAVNALMDLPLGPLTSFVEKWSYNLVLMGSGVACVLGGIRRREERLPWILIGSSMCLWTLGNIYYSIVLWDLEVLPVPSWSDAFWIIFYPGIFAGLMLLLRSRLAGVSRMLWLDGLIGALAVASLAGVLVVDPVMGSAVGDWRSILTNLTYPIADMVLITFAIGALSLNGWDIRSTFGFLCASLMMFAVFDSIYLVQVTNGTWQPGNVLEGGWPLAMLLMAVAASRPRVKRAEREALNRRMMMIPAVFSCVALLILFYDHFHRVDPFALGAATAALMVMIVRMTMTFRENQHIITVTRKEAVTDPLTELGNRRRLMRDLDEVLQAGTRSALVIYDLDGFKNYNDTYGHSAGDSLLARLGQRLAAASTDAEAYRMGGDEFCVLVELGGRDAEAVASTLAIALSEKGEGFNIGASYGWVVIPEEEHVASDVLRVADRRMYEQKAGGRVPARRQTSDVLLQVLKERDPRLKHHLHGVAHLASNLCARLGIDEEETRQVEMAAELHDVGKIAIPEAILNKPGPLNDEEWGFMHQHTVIGQRILVAAPALTHVGNLVRSTHERWDGTGYPDALAGEAIPLGARIVAVCDAFDAMVSDRPYRRGRGVEAALNELRRCSGAQFDTAVVEAFCEEILANPEKVSLAPIA